jgi:hypothetical protein
MAVRRPRGIPNANNTLLTYNSEANRLYIHILEWPMGKMHLPGFAGKIKYAQLLHDASEIRFTSGKTGNPNMKKFPIMSSRSICRFFNPIQKSPLWNCS